MTKRKKKNCGLKRQELVARKNTKNLAVLFFGGEGHQVVNMKNNVIFCANKNQQTSFSDFRHKWSMLLAVLGVTEDGKRFIKSVEIVSDKPYFMTELIAVGNKAHMEVVKNFNPKHLRNVAWLACSYEHDFDEKQAMEIFEKAGAFNITVEMSEDGSSHKVVDRAA